MVVSVFRWCFKIGEYSSNQIQRTWGGDIFKGKKDLDLRGRGSGE